MSSSLARSDVSEGREGLVSTLRTEMAGIEASRRQGVPGVVTSGFKALDRVLPRRGFMRGSLIEWLAQDEGTGAEWPALQCAREACREGGTLVVFDRRREFYPPAAVRLGIPPERIVVVQAANEADDAWAMDQALRCLGVGAVLIWAEKLDGRTFRRWQLAAEASEVIGLVIRPLRARAEPSWATARLLVGACPTVSADETRRLRIELLRVQGGKGGGCVEVECQ